MWTAAAQPQHSMQHTACNTQHATHSMQHTPVYDTLTQQPIGVVHMLYIHTIQSILVY